MGKKLQREKEAQLTKTMITKLKTIFNKGTCNNNNILRV